MKIEGGKHSESGEKPAKHYRFIKASGLQNGFSDYYEVWEELLQIGVIFP